MELRQFSLLLFFSNLFGSWDGVMSRKGDCVTSLYLGSDRLPGAGLSGLHLTRMVVDLPELQDWVTSLDLQSKQPPWGKELLIGAIGELLSEVSMEQTPGWGSLV